MDILDQLQNHYSTATIKSVSKYAAKNSTTLKKLLAIFLKGEKKMQHRAAWALASVGENNPKIILAQIEVLIEKLNTKFQHTSIYRSIFRCFQFSDIPEKYVAVIFDACLNFMKNENQESAVRAYAITVASKCAKDYVELKSELKLILNELMLVPQSKAVSVRIKRALKELD